MKEPCTPDEIAAARAGNEAALAAIIARRMPAIRYMAKKAACPGLDFDDAVQEGLIGLFAAIERYNPAGTATFETYANTCVRNAMVTARRNATREKHALLNKSVPLQDEHAVPGPEEEAIRREQVDQTMQRAKNGLSRFEGRVLRLFLMGYSYREIAVLLHKDEKAVDNALARMRRKLR